MNISANTNSFSFSELPFRAKLTYVAHAVKAVIKQHHTWMNYLLSKFISADSVVLDIGGHSGQYAKLFARLAPQGTIYTFEPGTYPRSFLEISIRLNQLRNVKVIGKALGEAPGKLTLVTPLKASGIFRFGLAHIEKEDENSRSAKEEVTVTTIDAFAKETGLESLSFIKIDVEGWEAQILKGGSETINRFHPTMMVELVASQLIRAGNDLDETWEMLRTWGYNPYIYIDNRTLVAHPEPRDGDTFWVHEQFKGSIEP
jgi:FkbM family methyltransferase